MKATKLSRRTAATLMMIAVLMLAAGGLSVAGKKPGGGGGGAVPPGRIFFHWSSDVGGNSTPEDRGFWSMNADGSDKRLVYAPSNLGDFSHRVHQGHRWFLAFGPSTRDDRYWALFAVRDDGHPDFTVMLVEESELPGDGFFMSARWGKDDSFVSFGAHNALDDIGEIWAANVAFDDVTGKPALASVPAAVVVAPLGAIPVHDWSPEGDQVVYSLAVNQGDGDVIDVVVYDLVTDSTRLLARDAIDPFWSPDGAKIAFLGAGIEVVNPDGTGRTFLTEGYLGGWSPDGKHILYNRVSPKNGSGGTFYTSDVLRIPAAGGPAVNLTKDIDGFASPGFWR
jgi:hypothetical protein